MAVIRLSPTEVQVDDMDYVFISADIADAFESCMATADANFCASQHSPSETRPSDAK